MASIARALSRGLLRALPYLVPALAIDLALTWGILDATGGELCPVLDDVFIHFQYARSFAELHPWAYHAGDMPSTGATSTLYPVLLAFGWLAGFRGMSMSIVAHAFAIVSLALLGYAAKRLGDALLGTPGGAVAAVAAYTCPAFDFLAAGGMEVAVTAATHVGAVAGAAVWLTARRRGAVRTARGALWLATLGALAAAARPEALLAASAVAFALLFVPADGRNTTRLLAPLPILPAFIPALVAWATTGITATNGAIVKWVFSDPYLTREQKLDEISSNMGELWGQVFAGKPFAHVLVYPAFPTLFRVIVPLGLLLLVFGAWKKRGGAGLIASLLFLGASLAMIMPITYSWIGNLGRYVLTYAPMATIGAALGGVVLGRVIAHRAPRLAFTPALVGGLTAALFVVSVDRAYEEPIAAASQICQQQVKMAEIVRRLPSDAVVALNDAGAIAYLGEHQTFDMVGLTSFDAARAYVDGPGAVFERMERLPRDRRPTHLAYYPNWFRGMRLGEERIASTEAAGIYVGNRRKELWTVRPRLFWSGKNPFAPPADETLVDQVDVADLWSERAHGYSMTGLLRQQSVFQDYQEQDITIADGGRVLKRGETDRFVFHATAGQAATWVFRTDAWFDATLNITWNDEPLQPVRVRRTRRWLEVTIEIPATNVRAGNAIVRSIETGENIGLFHDWLYQ